MKTAEQTAPSITNSVSSSTQTPAVSQRDACQTSCRRCLLFPDACRQNLCRSLSITMRGGALSTDCGGEHRSRRRPWPGTNVITNHL